MSIDNQQQLDQSIKKAQAADLAGRITVGLLLLVGSIVFMAPFYLMLTMSLKTRGEIDTTSVWSWPQTVTWDNYKTVLQNPNVNFVQFFKNTVFVAALSTLGCVLSSSMVAYGFARIKFAGRDRLFILVIATMMLPGIVTMIPTYVLYKYLNWVNTYYPLIVPAYFGGGAFNIFLLRQYFMGIPRELDEAAILDGASHWTIFSRVVLPLSGPALATVGIFAFIYNWRDFMGPLLYLNDPQMQTLEVGLSTYNSLRDQQWHLLMAGSVLVSVPLIIIFFVGQRYFVKGIVMSGMK
ncbi:MAG: carbohydrate ABC transporter permease [Armatimonadetes bacterium]|nr:carbohydrate ABC transporter permease [Armatimonadota bacterium]